MKNNKNYLAVGLLIIVLIGGFYLYTQYKKKKKATDDAAALAAKSDADKRTVLKSELLAQLDKAAAPPLPDITGNVTALVQTVDYNKFKNTITSDIPSTGELQVLYDKYVLSDNDTYVGVDSAATLTEKANEVLSKYKILIIAPVNLNQTQSFVR